MSYLELQEIEKSFQETPVLRNFNLSVQEGEFITIVGPSGCGKTTLLRIIAGLETNHKGKVSLENRDITALPPHERNISMVFQSYALFPNLNVFGNIAFGLWAKRLAPKKIKEIVFKLLEKMGLHGLENRFPHELSGGQQQRVALARALAPEPKVLLLDEPLSAVDAVVRARLQEELKRIQRNFRITTLMVTHDQKEALAIADRVVVMNRGKIEQIGTPREVYRHPANLFVARFIGTSNLLKIKRGAAPHQGFFENFPLILPPIALNGAKYFTIHLRPEALSLQKNRDKINHQWNALPGKIRWRTFLGSFTRFEVTVNEEYVLHVDVTGKEADQWHEGEEVFVVFSPLEIQMIAQEEHDHD